MNIADRQLGPGYPVFLVAEISCSHEGSLEKALALIDHAASCGADAVKFQLFTPDDMTLDRDDARFVLPSGPWAGRRLYDLYQQAQTPVEWFPELFAHARQRKLIPFATVCSHEGVGFLERLDCPAYKIASPELPWLPFIQYVADHRKPLVLSTGAASFTEVMDGWLACSAVPAILLHCVSAYPTPVEHMNLRRMRELPGGWYGLSDHSLGMTAAIAAVALGAVLIEKHLMLPRPNQSLDQGHSLTPDEFTRFVTAVRETEAALGRGGFTANPAERGAQHFRRRPVGGRWVRCAA